MTQGWYIITRNEKIALNTYEMILSGDTSGLSRAGQFINIALDGFYLRRPISVCDYDGESITIIYKKIGAGTGAMTALHRGHTLDVLTGLGNGFDVTKSGDAPLLVGGGAGVAPLYKLASELLEHGTAVRVVMGFNTADEVYYAERFENLGAQVFITTMSGTFGTAGGTAAGAEPLPYGVGGTSNCRVGALLPPRLTTAKHNPNHVGADGNPPTTSTTTGVVTDVMKNLDYTYFYSCGPEPMLRAVYDISKTSGQLSLEARMACGFGACMGCSCKTSNGSKRLCREGPVLEKEELLWQTHA